MTVLDVQARPLPRNAGFSLVEVVVVLAILGILANLAIPVIEGQLWRARAADVIGDFHQFEKAFHEYERDHAEMPTNGTATRFPSEFAPYLDGTFRWQWPQPTLRAYVWENWERKAHGRATGVRYGFSLKQPRPELVAAIQKLYDGRFEPTVYQKWTFIIAGFED